MVADCHWAPFMTLKAITCAAAVQEMVACPSVRLGQQAWHHRYSQSQAYTTAPELPITRHLSLRQMPGCWVV